MSLTAEQKEQIKAILQEEGEVLNLFAFEAIPEKALQGARKKYATDIGNDESIILLKDDTLGGSGKEGFLLTDKRLFNKVAFEKTTILTIDSVANMSARRTGNGKSIVVDVIDFKTDSGVSSIYFGSQRKLITKEHLPMFYILQKIFALLRGPSPLAPEMPEHLGQASTCQSCGAHSSGSHCEYCNKPF